MLTVYMFSVFTLEFIMILIYTFLAKDVFEVEHDNGRYS